MTVHSADDPRAPTLAEARRSKPVLTTTLTRGNFWLTKQAARKKDVTDAALLQLARHGDHLVASCPNDLEPLARTAGVHGEIIRACAA